MKLYEHKTDGGAEYYSTTFIECANGEKEGTVEGIVIRTDNDELEIASVERLKKAGFKSLKIQGLGRIQL